MELAPAPAASHEMLRLAARSQVWKKGEGAGAGCGTEQAGFELFAHAGLFGGERLSKPGIWPGSEELQERRQERELLLPLPQQELQVLSQDPCCCGRIKRASHFVGAARHHPWSPRFGTHPPGDHAAPRVLSSQTRWAPQKCFRFLPTEMVHGDEAVGRQVAPTLARRPSRVKGQGTAAAGTASSFRASLPLSDLLAPRAGQRGKGRAVAGTFNARKAAEVWCLF